MSALGEAALRYADRGWRVFPIVPRGKVPLIPGDETKAIERGWGARGHGCKDGTTDAATIRRWWGKEPQANIGLTTGSGSGVWAIDLDSADSAASFRREHRIGTPLIQQTARGWHLLYRWTDECEGLSISAGQLGEGVDMRGEGGYIVIAPSTRPEGSYRWHNDVDPGDPPTSLIAACRVRKARKAPSKPSLFERVDGRASRWGEATIEGLCRKVRDAAAGQQETLLNWAAYRAGNIVAGGEAASGYAFDQLYAVARMMGSHDPGRPWHDEEIRWKIERGITDGKAEPKRAGALHDRG